MAITATATQSNRKRIMHSLCMTNPTVVTVNPIKDNIFYSVINIETIEKNLFFTRGTSRQPLPTLDG